MSGSTLPQAISDISNISNIPEELAQTIGWCGHYNGKPLIDPNKAAEAYTLTKSTFDPSLNGFGFITSPQNPFVIVDIDCPKHFKEAVAKDPEHPKLMNQLVIDPLPQPIKDLIAKTYTEYSRSRTGLHLVMKCHDKYLTKKAYIKGRDYSGQVSFKNNFMVMTGDVFNATLPAPQLHVPNEPLTVTYAELQDIFNLTPQPTPASVSFGTTHGKAPTIASIHDALSLCKLDQNTRVRAAYKAITGNEYEHYDYWLTIAMALHSWATEANKLPQGYSMFLDWSQTDPTAYDGEEQTQAKWMSFANQAEAEFVSWRTLLKFASMLEFDYPRKQKDKPNPLVNEYVNFEYLLDKYNIKLYESLGTGVFVTGDDDIMRQYFMPSGASNWFGYYGPISVQALSACVLLLCQGSKWRGLSSGQALTSVWLTRPKEELDIVKVWLDTPHDELPQVLRHPRSDASTSTFKFLNSCITWDATNQDAELSKEMLYKTFMQFVKFHEPQSTLPFFKDNGGMLAFIGPENTKKTTFFKMLLPEPLSFLRKDVNQKIDSDKGMRDFLRYLGKKAYVLIDEFEGFMDHKKSGSILKSIISGNSVSMTEIYSSDETELVRKAVIVGTSNERRLIMSDNGSRRMWLCEVSDIDTTSMLDIDWHIFYNNMRDEFRRAVAKGETPWLMSMEKTKNITSRNSSLQAKNDLYLALEELFPYDEPITIGYITKNISSIQTDKSGHLYTTLEIKNRLAMAGFANVSLAALSRALERFSKNYFDFKDKALNRPNCVIVNGQLCQVYIEKSKSYKYKKWLMPKDNN